MPKGLSGAAKSAAAYVAKHAADYAENRPGVLNAEQIAKKYKLHPSTVYRSAWWKQRMNCQEVSNG